MAVRVATIIMAGGQASHQAHVKKQSQQSVECRRDGAQAGRQAVHVVEEVDGVGNAHQPDQRQQQVSPFGQPGQLHLDAEAVEQRGRDDLQDDLETP